ncbi:MAG TPA: hypothetical protein ENK95_02190 [Campylobacterales bacterium]|nr:hypothetical protein [Campylobacterales bacterium]
MSEKDEVLQQINEIKNHLVDKEAFFPYNYNACHSWSVIAVMITLIMIPAYEYSIRVGTVVMFALTALGFVIEGRLIKKENESYDIDECTKRQGFIMKNFLMISLFAIVLSTVLAMHQLYAVIYLLWLFLISLGHFAVGFVLNIKDFTKMAQFNVLIAWVLLVLGAYFDLLSASSTSFVTLTQAVVIFGLAILPSMVAIKQQKGEQQRREACSV